MPALPPVPRFDKLKARSATSSRVGAANRREGTAPEMILRRTLWAAGLRYRLHVRGLPGRPDLVVARWKIVVFCDGDFWHGRNWRHRRQRLGRGWNAAYWVAKIERNRKRDRTVNSQLRAQGWLVLRVWEGDLRSNPEKVAKQILTDVSTWVDDLPRSRQLASSRRPRGTATTRSAAS